MNKIPISRVFNRQRSLAAPNHSIQRMNSAALYESSMKKYNIKNIMLATENWLFLNPNKDLAFTKVMEMFSQVCEHGTVTDLNKMTNYISENVVPKVRDANQMQTYLKQKLGRLKTKLSTKINGKVDAAKVAARTVLPSELKSLPTTTNIKESYERLLTKANECVHCDRVISNNILISKRFNIDAYVHEHVTSEDTIKDCILELCSFIDTYECGLDIKYNTALECVLYSFHKHGITYESKNIVRDVTDYFLMNMKPVEETSLTSKERKELKSSDFGLPKERAYPIHDKAHVIAAIRFFNKCPKGKEKELARNIKRQADKFGVEIHDGSKISNYVNESSSVESLRRILKTNRFFGREDMEEVDFLIGKNDGIKQFDYFFNSEEDTFSYDLNDMSTLDSIAESELTAIVEESNSNKVKDLINAYKLQPEKTPETLRSLMAKVYTCNAENIIGEYPNMLQWIFQFFVVAGALAINPILAVVAGMTNYLIHMHLQRKECKKMLDVYYKQKEKAEKKLEKLESAETKERTKKYIEQLDKDIKKIEDYYEELLDEKEKDQFYANKPVSKDDDFNFDFNFNESSKELYELAKDIMVTESAVETLLELADEDLVDMISANIKSIPLEDIDSITDISLECHNVLEPNKLSEVLESHRMDLKRTPGNIQNYIRIDCLNDNIRKLKNSPVRESDICETALKCKVLKEALESYAVMNEMNFTNNINLIIERLKKQGSDLSAKEQIASRTLDASLEAMRNKIEKALTQENREAVIKGDILPPASKIIKLGITSGLAFLINPVLSVIVLLGTFAMNAKLRAKERQMVLDEIDVELQMVDRYIKIAEEKNDMKNLRELLKIQKKLQAQEARLRYKLNIEYKQDTTDSTKDRD